MSANTSDSELTVVTFGDFRLDFRLRTAYRGSEKLKISPIPFNTLEFLVWNRSRVVSKEELLEEVWGGRRDISTVEHAVSHIRRALQDDAEESRYIETVKGYGYRFVAEIRVLAHSDSDETHLQRSTETAGSVDSPSELNRFWSRFGPIKPWLLGAAVALVAATFATVAYRSRPIHVASVTINGNVLIARGISGGVLWTYLFDGALMDTYSGDWKWRTQVVDMNSDGDAEVLVAAGLANPQDSHGSEELLCISSRGKLLWRYQPQIQMQFNTPGMNGPWWFHGMIVVDDGRSRSVWVSVAHQVWWPAFLVKISPNGAQQIMFTSSGSINTLRSLRTTSSIYILAGGINNEYGMASVAVLDARGLPATSPQGDGAKYQCVRGCPSGRPYRYILLPRSEMNAASNLPYNNAVHIDMRTHGFTIKTEEVDATSQFFDFSEEFQPEWVAYSSDYPEAHRRYEKEGRLAHIFDLCPERHSPAVLTIFDENGVSRLLSVPRVQ